MAVPKRKTSKSRRDKRRASNIKYFAPNVVKCPKCNEPMMSHVVCAACGYYNGREVIEVKEA